MIRHTKSGNTNTTIVSQDFGENKYSKKYQSDNTNTTIVSQDFGGNKYSKIA